MQKEWPKTSYRSHPISSPSMMGEWGYYNTFGGFHGTTDTYAYVGLLMLVLKTLRHPKTCKWVLRQVWRRWVHRRCDTTDFHHDIYCLLDPYGKRLNENYRWTKVWTGN